MNKGVIFAIAGLAILAGVWMFSSDKKEMPVAPAAPQTSSAPPLVETPAAPVLAPGLNVSLGVPQETPGLQVAMLFSKLAREAPDFSLWSRQNEAYKNALTVEKMALEQKEIQRLQGAYSLLTLSEPIIVRAMVKLSLYSATTKGYLVDSFKDDTFFPVAFADRNYALVPRALMDRQWIGMPNTLTTQAVEAVLDPATRTLQMFFYLMPKTADAAAPADLGGIEYWMMGVDIQKMEIYSADGQTLWQSDVAKQEIDQNQQQLLDLYR